MRERKIVFTKTKQKQKQVIIVRLILSSIQHRKKKTIK
jgi:hypothetical protein